MESKNIQPVENKLWTFANATDIEEETQEEEEEELKLSMEDQTINAELRDNYLRFLRELSGKNVKLHLFDQMKLDARFVAMQRHQDNYLVDDLKTPTCEIGHAAIRIQDTIAVCVSVDQFQPVEPEPPPPTPIYITKKPVPVDFATSAPPPLPPLAASPLIGPSKPSNAASDRQLETEVNANVNLNAADCEKKDDAASKESIWDVSDWWMTDWLTDLTDRLDMQLIIAV